VVQPYTVKKAHAEAFGYYKTSMHKEETLTPTAWLNPLGNIPGNHYVSLLFKPLLLKQPVIHSQVCSWLAQGPWINPGENNNTYLKVGQVKRNHSKRQDESWNVEKYQNVTRPN
jgi:hypothetical protein